MELTRITFNLFPFLPLIYRQYNRFRNSTKNKKRNAINKNELSTRQGRGNIVLFHPEQLTILIRGKVGNGTTS